MSIVWIACFVKTATAVGPVLIVAIATTAITMLFVMTATPVRHAIYVVIALAARVAMAVTSVKIV